MPFCLAFVRTYLNRRPQGFSFFEGKALGTRLHISGCLQTLRFRKNTRPLEAYSNLFPPKRPNDGNTRVSLTGHALCKRMTSSVIENLRFRLSILTKTTLAVACDRQMFLLALRLCSDERGETSAFRRLH